jgi:GNAT superfamily N-acetyltransferase
VNESVADPDAWSESAAGTVISRLVGRQSPSLVEELADLLIDTVHGGASIGFLAPLDRGAAVAWWRERVEAVPGGGQAVWVARDARRVLGTVGLLFPDKPNSRHRAELVKLMVHREGRGRGLGRALLATAERAAAEAGVTLLHLDTETGSPAERLYDMTGWTRVGQIPDYAADPRGTLRPTSVYYKRVGVGVTARKGSPVTAGAPAPTG